MKPSIIINIAAIAFLLFSGVSFAEEKNDVHINKNAAIAGGTAAGATVVGAGVVASTASAATLTATIAAVGAGSMAVGIGVIAAVPIVVGGGVYAAYSWFSHNKKK